MQCYANTHGDTNASTLEVTRIGEDIRRNEKKA